MSSKRIESPRTPGRHRRQSPLAADERRRTILDAVVPLLRQRGPAVTTAEMAKAAGIAQGTIFHVFEDKQAVLDAAVAQVMDVRDVMSQIENLASEPSLVKGLTACADLVIAKLTSLLPIATMASSPDAFRQLAESLQEAITELLAQHEEALAHPPEQMAAMFFGLCAATGHRMVAGAAEGLPSSAQLAELFLDGARRRPAAT